MAGKDYQPIATYEVKIDNVASDNFVRVSGIGTQIEDIPSKDESGKNIVNTPGSSNAHDITLARRFSGDKALYNWLMEVKTKGNAVKLRTGSVTLLNSERQKIAQFDFDGAWLKDWQISEFSKDAAGNTISTETIVLSVNDVKMV